MKSLADRLATSLPGASFELEALVRLLGIHETTLVPTASVSCGLRARLRVNPEFVAEYCVRDEHLFLLVMHEMWHVLLGHTTLYGRTGPIENIAFDALINAGLARQHPQPEYRGFFEQLNAHNSFPSLLLRPPRGWPRSPDYDCPGPIGTREMMRRLYPPPGERPSEPTYQEIIALIKKGRPTAEDCERANLVGNHEPDESLDNPMQDPEFAEAVREIVGNWPPPPTSMMGRDAGGNLHSTWIAALPPPRSASEMFIEVLREVLLPQRAGFKDLRHIDTPIILGPGPLPNYADRTLLAKRTLLGELFLPNQPGHIRRPLPERPTRALVYFDVSGSMNHLLPPLLGLLAPLAQRGQIQVRQFSTKVLPVSTEALVSGEVSTTGGTDIRCVLTDILAHQVDRVLLLTDGYVGAANEDQLERLQERGIHMVSVLPHGGWEEDLKSYSKIYKLPRLEATQ